jgi:hypothetical protein
MKKNLIKIHIVAVALLSSFIFHPSSLLAQGALTPPGAPAPTMKSLDQLEPRTAITNAASTYTISVPGSYYLTTNLTVSSGSGIYINVSGVTLDLNGFTISSTAASAAYSGISLNGGPLSDITIVNGHIRSGVTNNGSGVYSGSGFYNGIAWNASPPNNAVISKVSVSGVLNDGIYLGIGTATVVEACTVTTAGSFGIAASTIKGSVATDCGETAIYGDQVADCRGISVAGGYGVSASATALNCYGQSSTSYGIYVSGGTAQNCYGTSSNGEGLYAIIAQNCYCYSASGVGLQATIANSCWIGHGTTNVTYKYNMP